MTSYKENSLLTVAANLKEIGERVAKIRLSQNITQSALAREAGASARSVKRLEAGENVSLDTLVRVLGVLNLGDRLVAALPDPSIRPVERVSRQGKERQRARSVKSTMSPSDWRWGSEEEK